MSRKHDGNGFVRRPWVKELAIVLALITITGTEAANDPIFTEGGGAVPYALEEEILEELARGQDKTDDRDFVGISSAGKEQKQENAPPDVIQTPPKDQQAPRPQQQQPQPAPVEPASSSESDKRPPPQPSSTNNNAKQQYEDLKSAAAAAIMKQTNTILQQQQKQEQKPAKQKKEGQEEFATFVDPFSQPAQNRRLAAEKPSFAGHYGHEEKRAQAGARHDEGDDLGDTVFIAVTTVCSAAAVFGLIGAGVCWYRLHKQYKAAQDVEYPHYGVTGPAKERTSGQTSPVAAMDAKLASSAQLYHYQHTKQQIIAMEHSTSDAKGQESEDSEGEGDEGDYSVYECPGLAPTGDIEVSNPLFENVASPHAKTDPRQQREGEQSPRVHQRSPVRGEDP